MSRDLLAAFLARQPVAILDGGLATELEARGHVLGDELWSARLLVDAPETIRRLHFDYLAAGADCIVSASYQASFAGFARRGLGEADAELLFGRCIDLALAARDDFWAVGSNRGGRQRPLVAASVGPYGAALADGSEYSGDYGLGARELARFHRRRLAVLARGGADLVACETVPSAIEARVLADLLSERGEVAAWISFSCRDGERIADGTPIAAVAEDLAACPALAAIGVNCTAPQHVASLVTALRGVSDLPIVVYPNSGERWDGTARAWRRASDAPPGLAAAAPDWVERGARLVGGCCRTGPRDIAALRRRLLGDSGGPST